MTPVMPTAVLPGATVVVFAKDQPQYTPLPAALSPDGLVMTEWEPSAADLERLLTGGHIRLWVWTHGRPLQPVNIEAVDGPCGSALGGQR